MLVSFILAPHFLATIQIRCDIKCSEDGLDEEAIYQLSSSGSESDDDEEEDEEDDLDADIQAGGKIGRCERLCPHVGDVLLLVDMLYATFTAYMDGG